MALRRSEGRPEGEPWVRLADVLAEAADVNPSRSFDEEAERMAAGLRGVRWDWANRPCITWGHAAGLLASLRAERRQVATRRAAEAAQAEAAARRRYGAGIVQVQIPGEPTWTSPTFVTNPNFQPTVTGPGE